MPLGADGTGKMVAGQGSLLIIDGTVMPKAEITGFSWQDKIEFTGISYQGASVSGAGNVLTIMTPGRQYTLNLDNAAQSGNYLLTAGASGDLVLGLQPISYAGIDTPVAPRPIGGFAPPATPAIAPSVFDPGRATMSGTGVVPPPALDPGALLPVLAQAPVIPLSRSL